MFIFIGTTLSFVIAGTIENDLNGLFNKLIIGDTVKIQRTIAILPFTVSGSASDASTEQGRALSEYAVSFFMGQPKYKIVERDQFQKAVSELALSQTGLIDDAKALDAGKMLAAQAIIVGSMGEVLGNKMISIRLIETETGTVLSAATLTVNADAVSNFAKEALGEQAHASGAVFRSTIIPGWGQFFVKKPVHGTLFLSAAGVGIGVLVYSIIDYSNKQATVDDISSGKSLINGESTTAFAARLKVAINSRNNAETTMTIAGSALAAVWIGNIIDAAILGSRNARRVQGLYFSMASLPATANNLSAALTYRW
jgi:TolB-like protein